MCLKKLGEGQFGKVYLVKDRDTKATYAIKCIPKHQVIKNKM
jgi:cGMP-dependent protein kinase